MFMYLCCLEESDRASTVVGATWPEVLRRLARQTASPDTGSLLQLLGEQALIGVLGRQGGTPTMFGIHPAIADTGREAAGGGFQAAVDMEMSSY